MGMILLNVAQMASYHVVPDEVLGDCVEPTAWLQLWKVSNYCFTLCFLVEMVLKIVALGRAYCADAWNMFDATLVTLSVGDILLELIHFSIGVKVTMLRVVRVFFRIGRLLRLVRSASGLRQLLITAITSLPSLVNVGSLLALLLFVYAVLGVNLFDRVAFGEYLNRHANFRTLPNAYMLLFRAVTGESWQGLMHDCMVEEWSHPNRCSEARGDCGSLPWAIFVFVSFSLAAGFSVLNLLVAIILQNFTGIAQESEQLVSTGLLEDFRIAWARFDPAGAGFMPSSQLNRLLDSIEQPLGYKIHSCAEPPKLAKPSKRMLAQARRAFKVCKAPAPSKLRRQLSIDAEKMTRAARCGRDGKSSADSSEDQVELTRAAKLRFLREARIPDHDGCVNFQELLQALSSRAQRGSEPPANSITSMRMFLKMEQARSRCHVSLLPEPVFSQAEVYAARLLQAHIRRVRVTRELSKQMEGKVKQGHVNAAVAALGLCARHLSRPCLVNNGSAEGGLLTGKCRLKQGKVQQNMAAKVPYPSTVALARRKGTATTQQGTGANSGVAAPAAAIVATIKGSDPSELGPLPSAPEGSRPPSTRRPKCRALI